MRSKRITGTLAERFWPKVDVRRPDECWPWLASDDGHGYGQIMDKARSMSPQKAHRIAWELEHGEATPADRLVCHTCDNPPCCNPAHLFLGTHADNVHDASAKDRLPRGDDHWMRRNPEKAWGGKRQVYGAVKIPEEAVRSIRASRAAGETLSAIAAAHGVTKATVWQITTGKTRVSVS